MGPQTLRKIVYVVICLTVASYFVHFRSTDAASTPKPPLSRFFADIADWEGIGEVDLEPDIVETLDLDDYLFRSYRKDDSIVSLYIGYYRTTGKIGAAHSPLVCFPGQGWEISPPEQEVLPTGAGPIRLEKLVARKGGHRELLVYWFQSYDKTSSGTFWQKVNNFRSKVRSLPEDNAFVRVSLPVHGDDSGQAYLTAIRFIETFYPQFNAYITNG